MSAKPDSPAQRACAASSVSLLLHWASLGIGARRAGRWVGFWVGGGAARVLLSWLSSEGVAPVPAPHHGRAVFDKGQPADR